MRLRSPSIPHFGDHEDGEDEDAPDWYNQESDAGPESRPDSLEDPLNAAAAEQDRPWLREPDPASAIPL